MELTINIDNWTVKDYRQFMKAFKDSDFEIILEKISKLIATWTLPGDPTDLAYYDTLKMSQWRDITAKVLKAIETAFDTKN